MRIAERSRLSLKCNKKERKLPQQYSWPINSLRYFIDRRLFDCAAKAQLINCLLLNCTLWVPQIKTSPRPQSCPPCELKWQSICRLDLRFSFWRFDCECNLTRHMWPMWNAEYAMNTKGDGGRVRETERERRHVRKGIKVSICIRCERQVNVTPPATNWRSVLHKQEPPNCQNTSKARKLQGKGGGSGGQWGNCGLVWARAAAVKWPESNCGADSPFLPLSPSLTLSLSPSLPSLSPYLSPWCSSDK